jgi:hypothetical protein
MALLPRPNLDQTDKDFDAIRARLYNLISVVFPDWTSQNVADFGNILVDLFSHVGDTLGFLIDNHARESRIATATQRRTLIALAKLLNFTPESASAAQVDCTITLDAVPTNDVEFDAGTIARTLAVTDPIKFQLLALATIPALTDPPTVSATFEHSETRTQSFAATGLPNQEITLGDTPFLDDSETITAANGVYTKVANFLSSGPTDRHYMVIVNQSDRATVRFGNGNTGELPTGTINTSYKIGGGSEGNVEQNSIKKLEGTFTDVLSNPVTATITNPLAASGGGPRQSTEEIRQEAPESLRALTRTVAREDYQINAKRVAGVERALMLTSNEDVRIGENAGRLLIVPDGGGTPSQATLDNVETMCTETYPNTLTFALGVFGAPYKVINVQTSVYLSTGSTPATVKAAIVENLEAYFALVNSDDGSENTKIKFGWEYQAEGQGADASIPFSDLYNEVRDTTGVFKIKDGVGSFLLNDEAYDVDLEVDEFPTLGTVTVIDASTGTEIS